MKNEILDVPFRNSFPDFLSKGETVLWEGHPTYTRLTDSGNSFLDGDGYENYAFWATAFLGTIILTIFSNFSPIGVIFFIVLVFVVKIYPWWKNRKMLQIKYAVTQNQILFQFKNKWKNENSFYSIPFSEIENIVIIKTHDFERMKKDALEEGVLVPYSNEKLEKMGTIFIVPHQPALIPFETKDLINNNKRHQPTLELLDDVEAVAKLIREGIQNANTLA